MVELQQPCILEQVLNALLLVLDDHIILLGRFGHLHLILTLLILKLLLHIRAFHGAFLFLAILEGRGRLAHVPLFDIVAVGDNNDILLAFHLDIGSLYGTVSTFLAFALVELAHTINLFYNFPVYSNPFL